MPPTLFIFLLLPILILAQRTDQPVLSRCTPTSPCPSPLKCMDPVMLHLCNDTQQFCMCFTPEINTCETTDDCLPKLCVRVVRNRKICVDRDVAHDHNKNIIVGQNNPSPSPALSPSPIPTASPSSSGQADASCVAVKHLSGWQVVYDRHRWANVLCDMDGSCATPGHVVVWEGIPMLMSTYCNENAQCSRKQMYVNNPKWEKAVRVDSSTSGLHFTAYAATWETALEETLLRHIVKIGL